MSKIFNLFSDRYGFEKNALRFQKGKVQINGNETPQKLSLVDGDEIVAILQYTDPKLVTSLELNQPQEVIEID